MYIQCLQVHQWLGRGNFAQRSNTRNITGSREGKPYNNHPYVKSQTLHPPVQFDIPQWVIDLRHQASHSSLPSAGRLRAGATFCLQWLKQYYWKQYQDIQLLQRPESCSASPVPAGGPPPIPLFPPKPKERQPAIEDVAVTTVSEGTGGAIGRLTRGLCSTKVELVNLLASSAYT